MTIHPSLRSRAVPLDELVPLADNPRVGDLARLRESLRLNGQYQPIVVRKQTNEILAGNHRFLAARAEGWDKIAVVYVDVDDETAKRIALVDNRTSDLAYYDDRLLVEWLAELADSELGLDGTGYSPDDFDELSKRLSEPDAPTSFAVDLPDETDSFSHTCPRCGFEFDG